MNKESLLREGASRLGIPLTDPCVTALLTYCRDLQKWSRRINLIARDSTEQQIIEKHFLDSLSLLPLLRLSSSRQFSLLDVGTGAGFPGLVLAAILPDATFTLVEPRKKRVSFLRHIIRTLELSNVEVLGERLEHCQDLIAGSHDFITSRAVTEPVQFLAMIKPLLVVDTRVILMAAKKQTLSGVYECVPDTYRVLEERTFTLPFSGAPRVLAVITSC